MTDDPDFSERARAFHDAQGRELLHIVQAESYSFDPGKYPKIATMAELRQLISERSSPAPELNIDGPNPGIVQEVNAEVDGERDERIRFLIDRLGQEQEDFEFSLDQARGQDKEM